MARERPLNTRPAPLAGRQARPRARANARTADVARERALKPRGTQARCPRTPSPKNPSPLAGEAGWGANDNHHRRELVQCGMIKHRHRVALALLAIPALALAGCGGRLLTPSLGEIHQACPGGGTIAQHTISNVFDSSMIRLKTFVRYSGESEGTYIFTESSQIRRREILISETDDKSFSFAGTFYGQYCVQFTPIENGCIIRDSPIGSPRLAMMVTGCASHGDSGSKPARQNGPRSIST